MRTKVVLAPDDFDRGSNVSFDVPLDQTIAASDSENDGMSSSEEETYKELRNNFERI